MSSIDTYFWRGEHGFQINGSGLHEDTLRVSNNYPNSEGQLQLVLPTLCITYADMAFQNAIGGKQENYPASKEYGPFFDPPKVINGEAEIEHLTYIRGASRVEIGPEQTIIQFPSWKDLVIPRLRIDQEKGAEAVLAIDEVGINVLEPLEVSVRQYADGRHVGGVKIRKEHPEFEPPQLTREYDIWIRVIDGMTLEPMQEAMVNVWHWEPKAATPYGAGSFQLADRQHTDGTGAVYLTGRPSEELEAVSVYVPGYRVVPRTYRPLSGQHLRLTMRAWPLTPGTMRFTWRSGIQLAGLAQVTGRPEGEILQLNRLRSAADLSAGMTITLPCYAATYRLESWDTMDWIGGAFGYRDAAGLARASGLAAPGDYDGSADLNLPDWRFFYARENDNLDLFDRMFGVAEGSSIAVGRVFRPEPRLLFHGETVAVPTSRLSDKMRRERRAL